MRGRIYAGSQRAGMTRHASHPIRRTGGLIQPAEVSALLTSSVYGDFCHTLFAAPTYSGDYLVRWPGLRDAADAYRRFDIADFNGSTVVLPTGGSDGRPCLRIGNVTLPVGDRTTGTLDRGGVASEVLYDSETPGSPYFDTFAGNGFSFCVRAKFANLYGSGVFLVTTDTNPPYASLRISNTVIATRDTTTIRSVALPGGFDPTAWHTYFFRRQAASPGLMQVYIDDSVTPVVSGTSSDTANSLYRWYTAVVASGGGGDYYFQAWFLYHGDLSAEDRAVVMGFVTQ